ncbi:MAG TPA: flavodoxin domain-containing protein [Herpetosiphonaceae bacterium]
MNTTVLVAYATRYGSTQAVAEAIAAALREQGLPTDLQPMQDVQTLADYSAVVLGAPLMMFRWHKDARRFLARHRAALMERPVALFTLGPVHDPHDAKEWHDSREQLAAELARFPWLSPVACELFGGVFDPSKLRFPINVLAGKAPPSDARDWTAIRAWANSLAAQLQPALQQEV